MMFFQVPVNYLAVLLCGVAAMIVGFAWYTPLFGRQWTKLVGLTEKKTGAAKKGMEKTYLISFASALVMAWFLEHVIWYSAPGNLTVFNGVKIAIYMWIGFVATTALAQYLYSPEKKPPKLYWLENAYHLVSLVVMSLIIVALGMG